MELTREQTLENLKQSATKNGVPTVVTLEGAKVVLADDLLERNLPLFEAGGGKVDLRELVAAQTSAGAKLAAFIAAGQNMNLMSYLALSKLQSKDDLQRVSTFCALSIMLKGELEGMLTTFSNVAEVLGMLPEGQTEEESAVVMDKFLIGLLDEAVELAYSLAASIPGDVIPGIVH